MTGDHQTSVRRLWLVEVVPTMRDEAKVGRSTEEIARLFEVAGREDEAIGRLDGCMAELREVRAARLALTAFTPAELQAALAYRRRRLDGRTA